MAQEIKFGTDGWRGLIADDFTFDNVRRVAGAIASYVLKYEDRIRRPFCIAPSRANRGRSSFRRRHFRETRQ
jgi:phosphomannomutase